MPRRLACLVAAAAALPLAAAYRAGHTVFQRTLLSQRQLAGAALTSQEGSSADIGLTPVVAPLSLRHVGGAAASAMAPPTFRAPAGAPLVRLQSASAADAMAAIADGAPTDVGSFARMAAGLAPFVQLSALQVSLEAWALFETSMSFAKGTASSLASASRGLQAKETRIMRSLAKICEMEAVKSVRDAVVHAKVQATETAPAIFEKRRRQAAQMLQQKASGMMGDLDREAERLKDDMVEYAELHAKMRQRSGMEGAVAASEHEEEAEEEKEEEEEEEEELEDIESKLEKLTERVPTAFLQLFRRIDHRFKAQELRVALTALAGVDVTMVKNRSLILPEGTRLTGLTTFLIWSVLNDLQETYEEHVRSSFWTFAMHKMEGAKTASKEVAQDLAEDIGEMLEDVGEMLEDVAEDVIEVIEDVEESPMVEKVSSISKLLYGARAMFGLHSVEWLCGVLSITPVGMEKSKICMRIAADIGLAAFTARRFANLVTTTGEVSFLSTARTLHALMFLSLQAQRIASIVSNDECKMILRKAYIRARRVLDPRELVEPFPNASSFDATLGVSLN